MTRTRPRLAEPERCSTTSRLAARAHDFAATNEALDEHHLLVAAQTVLDCGRLGPVDNAQIVAAMLTGWSHRKTTTTKAAA